MNPSDDRLVTLVRQALTETPAATQTTDPVALIQRRVHRARRRFAIGAGAAAAALVAAVVVPLTVGGGSAGGKVRLAVPAPTPTTSPNPPGVTTLWTNGAIWASAPAGGQPWLLYRDESGPKGDTYVASVGSTGPGAGFVVPDPADYVLAGDHSVWVYGSTDHGTTAVITLVDAANRSVVSMNEHGWVLTDGAVAGDSLYVVAVSNSATVVQRFDRTNSSGVSLVSSTPVSSDASHIVATADGHLWVQCGPKLAELIPTPTGVDVGAGVLWGTGAIFSATGQSTPAGLWAYDGRVIDLSPKLLLAGTSVAEGTRVAVAGRPGAVVQAPDGGLYVAVVEPSAGATAGGPGIGLYYYSPAALRDGNTPVTASVPGVQVVSMAIDPAGGVDYVDENGVLDHWDPAAGTG